MASGRMLQRKISKNESLPLVIQRLDEQMGPPHGAYAALLFTWCIAHQDVEGRMEGDPRIVRAHVFTMLEWVSSSDVERYLAELTRAGLIVWYEAVGRKWISFPSFSDSQPGLRRDREAPSNIPAPESGQPLLGGAGPELLRRNAGAAPALKLEVRNKKTEQKPPASASPSPGPIAQLAENGNAVAAAEFSHKPSAPVSRACDAASRSGASKSASMPETPSQDEVPGQSTPRSGAGATPELLRQESRAPPTSDASRAAPDALPLEMAQPTLPFGSPTPAKRTVKHGPSRPEVQMVLDAYRARWVATRRPLDGLPPACTRADFAQLRMLVGRFGAEETQLLVERYLEDADPWLLKQGHTLRHLPSRVDGYRARAGPLVRGDANMRRGPVPVAKGLDFRAKTGASS